MNTEAWVALLAVGVFVGMVGCLDVGYRLGTRMLERQGDAALEGTGAIEAAVFGFFALLLAFSFSGATSRLDDRRQLIIEETNAIGTAYLRVDLLESSDQPEMRRLFREYLDTRLRVYEKLHDEEAAMQELAQAAKLQQAIWSRSVAATTQFATDREAELLLPAINAMIDVTTARTIALHTHLPTLVAALLILIALLTGLIAGYALAPRKHRSWVHSLLYAGVVAATIYVVFDIEHPRVGLVRLDAADKALSELRDSIR